MAAAVLHDLGRGNEVVARYPDEPAVATVLAMLEKKLNCPRTSSAGRLFDAASGLLGLCLKMEMDAEAAIKLEQAATRRIEAGGWPQAMADGWRLDAGVLDLRPLLGELAGQRDAEQGAALFHATLVAALSEWTQRACAAAGIETVALGGGCFFNRLLATGLRRELEKLGLRVLAPIELVPGDAGLALGQAWVALHTLESR
jgi:hydrogenase maturation protein HypF